MPHFQQPVLRYMKTDVAAISQAAPLDEVARRLDERRVSALPVVDRSGAIVGVISRSDLLHAGRLRASAFPGRRLALSLPDWTALAAASRPARTCAATATLAAAAREMRRHRVHRLFVVDGDRPIGVISTLELAAAVRDARIESPLSEVMSSPVFSVPVSSTFGAAVALLDAVQVTGLVVVDDRWPIGMFTQTEALAARDLPRDTPIEDLHDPSILCMPATTPLHRAAAQAARLEVRRVVACADREAVGMVSGLDFAWVAGSWANELASQTLRAP